jgi:uncharacterized membrane protein
LGLGFKLEISLWRDLCDYLLIKKSFLNSIGLLKLKILIGYMARTSQNGKKNIDSHFKFVIRTQYIM